MSAKKTVTLSLKIALDAVVSLLVFLVLALVLDLIASKIFGTHTGPDGAEVLNVNGGVMVVVTLALTLMFSYWFFKVLTKYKVTRAENKDDSRN